MFGYILMIPYLSTCLYSYIYYPQYSLITIVFSIRAISDIIFELYFDKIVIRSSNKLIAYSYIINTSLLYIISIMSCIIERQIGLPIITINIIIDILLIILNLFMLYLVYIMPNQEKVIEISDTTSKIIDASKTDECLICREEYNIADKIKELKCGHLYHIKCIDDWFKRINKVECPFHCT